MRIRIDEPTEKKLRDWARSEGKNISEIARDALERHFADEEGHIERVTASRRKLPPKREDQPLPQHSPGLRIDRLLE